MVIEAYQYLTEISLQNTTSTCNTETVPPVSPKSRKTCRKRPIPSDCGQIEHVPKSYRQTEPENINRIEENEIKIENPEFVQSETLAEDHNKPANAPIRSETNLDIAVIDSNKYEVIENGNESFELDFGSSIEIEQIETLAIKQVRFFPTFISNKWAA